MFTAGDTGLTSEDVVFAVCAQAVQLKERRLPFRQLTDPETQKARLYAPRDEVGVVLHVGEVRLWGARASARVLGRWCGARIGLRMERGSEGGGGVGGGGGTQPAKRTPAPGCVSRGPIAVSPWALPAAVLHEQVLLASIRLATTVCDAARQHTRESWDAKKAEQAPSTLPLPQRSNPGPCSTAR